MDGTQCLVPVRIDEFRTSYVHHELGCTIQKVEMERRQGSPDEIEKYGELKDHRMAQRARLRGIPA